MTYSLIARSVAAKADKLNWGNVTEVLRRNGLDKAHDLLDNRLAAHPRDSLIYYYKARLYYESGSSTEALSYADKAISLGYAQEISHLLKALVHGRLLGDYRRQKELASKTLSYDPTYDDGYLVRAEAEYRLGEYADCVSDAASYISLSPKDVLGYETSMLCLEGTGDYAGAEKAGLRLLELDPKNHAAYWRLGRVYLAAGRGRLAIKKFGRAIELSGGRPAYYADRARACEAEGDLSCAAWDYFVAAAFPELSACASSYHLLGSAMYRIGEFDEALEAAGKALKKEPRNPAHYLLRGRVLADSGRAEKAAADFRAAASLSPTRRAEALSLLRRLSDPSLR